MDFTSPEIAHIDFTKFMREAMREAEISGQAGDLPIGAVVMSVETNPYIKRHIRSYQGGVLAKEAAALVRRYDPRFLEVLAQERLPGV